MRAVKKSQYIVVCGPKGVGKTCVVDTATARTYGVVNVRIAAGFDSNRIVTAALSAIARVHPSMLVPSVLPSARRVIFFHGLFFGRPTVVLNMAERQEGDKYAGITGAVRELVALGLNVIVDASNNSLAPGALATERQGVLELEPMRRDVLEGISGFNPMLDALTQAGLHDVVWAVLGGSPASYELLHERWTKANFAVDITPVVRALVEEKLVEAIRRRNRAVRADAVAGGSLEELYGMFQTKPSVREFEIPTVILPSPDKVLRAVKIGANAALIPADAAIGLVLRHRMQSALSLEELRAIIADEKNIEASKSDGGGDARLA